MLARDAVKTSNLFATLNHQKTRPAAVVVKQRDGGSVSGSSTASIDTSNATTPTSTGDKKKRKKKKNGSSKSKSADSGGDNQETNGHTGEANGKRKSIFQVPVSNGDVEESTDPSQLPLSKRLEIAAAHGDIHAALVGLLGWSRMYVNTDTIMEFFQSSALAMLLENIFRACPATDAIYDNLNALLANCLSNERDGKPSSSNRGIANTIVGAVRSIVDKLRGSCQQQDNASLKKAAEYLSKIVLHYRLALNGVEMGSTLSQEIIRIDAELATAAARDGAVKGQAIRDTFQRRDIRCEALALYESRLATINKLVEDNISSSIQLLQAGKDDHHQTQNEAMDENNISSGFTAFAAEEEDNQLGELDPKELEAIKLQLKQLNDRKVAAIAPLVAKREAADAVLQDLKSKREDLEAQLRALNCEIDDNASTQQELDEQIGIVEEKFEDEMSRFDTEHQHVIQQYQRKERHEHIDATFSELQDAITKISLEHSDVQSLKEKRVVCMRQHLEGILRYFASELPCVKFMMGRVEQSEAQLKKYTDEAHGYKALGVSAVAKDLLEKAAALQGHIVEDKSCLQALQKRDLELLDTVKHLFCDPTHADSFSAQELALTKEVQRHVDYVRKVYEPLMHATVNGNDSDAKPSSPAKNGVTQKKQQL